MFPVQWSERFKASKVNGNLNLHNGSVPRETAIRDKFDEIDFFDNPSHSNCESRNTPRLDGSYYDQWCYCIKLGLMKEIK